MSSLRAHYGNISQDFPRGKKKIIPTIRAKGLTFSLLAASVVISTKAAAPSFRVLAFAAVTVPRKGKTFLRQRCKCYAKQLTDILLRIVFP